MVESYTKPKKFKAPKWRQPREYDEEFMEWLDIPYNHEVIRFNYNTDVCYLATSNKEFSTKIHPTNPHTKINKTIISPGEHLATHYIVSSDYLDP